MMQFSWRISIVLVLALVLGQAVALAEAAPELENLPSLQTDSQLADQKLSRMRVLMQAQANAGSVPGKPIASAEMAKFRTEAETNVAASGMRMVKALGICLGLFFIGVYLYKRFAHKAVIIPSRRMRVIDRVSVAAKTTLVLVEVEGRTVLMAVGGEKVAFLPYDRDEAAFHADLRKGENEDAFSPDNLSLEKLGGVR